MNKLLFSFITILFFYSITVFSQKEANVWYFGEDAGLSFNTNPPTALTNGQLNTDEGCSSFSDANGNLLFYSDGISVYNKNHDFMRYSNGDLANNLEGNPSSTQSGMIIPKPNDPSIYYLFTVGTDFTPDGVVDNPGFNYYTIDMNLNSQLGEITEGPINLSVNPFTNEDLNQSWSEKVTAVKGKECNTFWILSFVTDSFFAYKVTETGVDVNNVVITKVNFTSLDKRGYLQVSPNGKKIAFADFNLINSNQGATFNGSLQLFNFNDDTGVVDPVPEPLIRQNTGQSPYGVSFSQQSNKLYASLFDNNFSVYQFDLESSDPEISKTLINSRSGFRGALQLGPDGKIYASIPDNTFLDVIENPNENAANVIYSENAISLGGKFAKQGLPPFISSLLLPVEISDITNNEIINNKDLKYCNGQSIVIETESITGSNITYSWTFDDGNTISTLPNTSTLSLTNLSSANNGIYNVIISLEDTCNNSVTFEGTFNIEVFEAPIANTPTDINFCDLDGFNSFDLDTDITPQILGTQDANVFEVLFFLTENDAINNTNPLSIPYTNTTEFTSENIYSRIHNTEAPNTCFDITNFNLSISQIPQPTQPINYAVCDDAINGSDTDGFFNDFILSSKDQEILGNLNASLFNISYHTTLSGAQTNNTTNVINKNTPYRNTTIHEQVIYVRIENINNTNCYITSENNSTTFSPFSLIINPLPAINASTQLVQCDVDNDLTTTVNLTLSEINISTNYTNETFTYFPTQNDALLNISEIIDTTNYTATDGDKVWVRVTSSENCYRISELNFIISFNGTLNYNQSFIGCDDEIDTNGNDSDMDGVTSFDFSSVSTDIISNYPLGIQSDLDVLIFETIEDRDTVENYIEDLTKYRNTNIPAFTSQNLYIKVINITNNSCVGLAQFTITVNPLPYFNITTPQIFCSNNSPLTIEVENPDGIYTYAWTKDNDTTVIDTNTSLDITAAGAYHIKATNTTTLCSRTRTILTEESEIATINQNTFTIREDTTNNSITINESNLGVGDYEYALLNEDLTETIRDYQDAPFFDHLEGGIYTVSIQDKNNCGTITSQVSIIEFPKFLTPNNDGYNDTWSVKGINNSFYPTSTIYIFNRFGKQLAEILIGEEGWDGTFNGKPLPPNDYWYSVQLMDAQGKIKNKKGHFSLLRN